MGLLGDCYTEEQMNAEKNKQIEAILGTIKKAIQEWDSTKCPTIRAYMERLEAATRNPVEEEEIYHVASMNSKSSPADEGSSGSAHGPAHGLLLLSLSGLYRCFF